MSNSSDKTKNVLRNSGGTGSAASTHNKPKAKSKSPQQPKRSIQQVQQQSQVQSHHNNHVSVQQLRKSFEAASRRSLEQLRDNIWVLLWSLKMLNCKPAISLSKSSYLALKTIIFLIDLGSRDLDQNVKMSDQSNAQVILVLLQRLLVDVSNYQIQNY